MAIVNNLYTNFSTANLTDKVIHKVSGSRSVPQAVTMADSVLITIPHSLGYAPLCIGQFSETSDFSIAYEFGSGPQQYNGTYMMFLPRISAVANSDSNNIYVSIINFDTTRTIYYRVACLIPSGVTNSPVMDIDLRDDILFTTNDNFLKINIDSTHTLNLSVVTPQTITIPHNLGYRPMALVFTEGGGTVRRSGTESIMGVTGITSTASIDETNLYVVVDSFGPPIITVHYRIYLDN